MKTGNYKHAVFAVSQLGLGGIADEQTTIPTNDLVLKASHMIDPCASQVEWNNKVRWMSALLHPSFREFLKRRISAAMELMENGVVNDAKLTDCLAVFVNEFGASLPNMETTARALRELRLTPSTHDKQNMAGTVCRTFARPGVGGF